MRNWCGGYAVGKRLHICEDRAGPGSGHWHGNKTTSCVTRQCDSVRDEELDGWIVWEAEEGLQRSRPPCFPFSLGAILEVARIFPFIPNGCSGESYPELCAQCTAEAEDFLMFARPERSRFLLLLIMFGVEDVKRDLNQSIKSVRRLGASR